MGELIFQAIIDKFDNIYTVYVAVFVVLSGVYLCFYDARRLRIRKDTIGHRIAKAVGYVYMIGGAALYVITLII